MTAARRDRAASSSDPSVPDDRDGPAGDDGHQTGTDGVDDSDDGRVAFDEDAAWRAIVENYDARPDPGGFRRRRVAAPEPPPPPAAALAGPGVFDRTYLESLPGGDAGAASWHDEGHFVPPEPPPMPRATPARRLAWLGLFGSPLLMLLAVVLGWSYPGLGLGAARRVVRRRASSSWSPRWSAGATTGRATTARLCRVRRVRRTPARAPRGNPR